MAGFTESLVQATPLAAAARKSPAGDRTAHRFGATGEGRGEEKVTLRVEPCSWTIHARGALLDTGNFASADPAEAAPGFAVGNAHMIECGDHLAPARR